MDKHFMSIALIGVIIIGTLGVIAGAILTFALNNPQAGAVCLSLGTAAVGALAGVLAAPRVYSTPPTPPAISTPQIDPLLQKLMDFQGAVQKVAASVNPKE